ncbi:MAG: DUF2993 domain-containing protein, partial [Armatimonadetes bacterium]|nr:DUF2993 domain-containing protein [Armatimonadota bacterium]
SRRQTLALGLLGALPGLVGCSTVVVRRGVERRVERRLGDLLGPAEGYQVRIRGSRDPDLVRGYARRVEVRGRGILARGQLRVERLDLTLEDLRYEGGEPYFVSVGRSELEVEFTDAALNRYLSEYHGRYQPSVRFLEGQVEVRMLYRFLGAPTPLRAVGRFQVEEGKKLNFEALEADVPFISADQPEFRRRFVQDRVNPLLDLTRLEFPAQLESVELSPGRLKARGTANLPREVRE